MFLFISIRVYYNKKIINFELKYFFLCFTVLIVIIIFVNDNYSNFKFINRKLQTNETYNNKRKLYAFNFSYGNNYYIGQTRRTFIHNQK